ncbi:MAG: TetR/AcrR family transcriptional regulator [Deltaproteobacteria bacterium]|nr:TetR/AcrR family transcriptional regulator [Deltaproteobacteria bacterium]
MGETAVQTPVRMLQWVRTPQQARTREGLTRLLDAAETLVAAKGFDEAGIAEIARMAQSSVGAFYRRFADKDGLLHALHERFCDEARATADETLDPSRWTGAPTDEVAHEFTAFIVQVFREREGFFRAILQRGTSDGVVRERTDRLFEHLAERLAALLRGRSGDIAHRDPKLAAIVGLRVVVGALTHTIQAQPHTLPLSDERLAAELARVFIAYLGVSPPTTVTTQARRRTPQ